MKTKFKMVPMMLAIVLLLAVFPTMGVNAWRSYACNQAQFIMDVTVPDGSRFAPGDTFTKTWRVQNVGTCEWTPGYSLVFTSGDAFGAATSVNLTAPVPRWSYVDLTIPGMVAPATPGKYISNWKLDNGSGAQFGVGWGGGVPIFALINVVTPPPVLYDFTAEANSAIWTSGIPGSLTFPGKPGDTIGSVFSDPAPHFENNVTASTPGLVVAPNDAYNGFIQGYFTTAYTVQRGDRFRTTIGCEYGHTTCYVAFSLKYQIGSGPVHTLWTFRERYEGLTYSANINLDWLAGKTVNFILYMSAYGSPAGDSAIWGNPVIVGKGTSSGSSGGSTAGWNTYTHTSPEIFQFKFPSSAFVSSDGVVRFPPAPGTNLLEKRLDVSVAAPSSSGDCKSSLSGGSSSTSVTINGKDFTKEIGSYPGTSPNVNDWVAYTTKHDFSTYGGTEKCVSISLTLLSNPSSPNPAYNFANETAILDNIIATLSYP